MDPTPLLDTLAKYAPLLNTFVLGGVAWLINQFGKVNAHLSVLNGRMGKVESEAVGIKALTNERHTENARTLERMEDRLKGSCRFPECPPAKGIWGGGDRRHEK